MQLTNNQLEIGRHNVFLEVLHYVEFSICGSIGAVTDRKSFIWCGSLGSHFNSLLMQKLEIGTIPGFGNLAICKGLLVFFIGVGESNGHE